MSAPLSSCALSEDERPQNASLSDMDHAFVQASIRLGQSRLGMTSPNPSVGTIIVRHEEEGAIVVGRGVTADNGRPHGEVLALQEAGDLARGATCYVSLEPCSHHGRTPPCVDALLSAGVARVVIALYDPDPRVSGNGAAFLLKNDIQVDENVAVRAATLANLGHVVRVKEGRPAITLKLALSRDGMIGRKGDGMVPITGPLSRRLVHSMRARADVLMVGVGTILADDPDLTCRLPAMEHFSPKRAILDTHARTPLDATLFDTIDDVPVMIFVGEDVDPAKKKALEAKGAEVIAVSGEGERLSLKAVMSHLAEDGCTNLMVEGGASLAQSLLEQDLVDCVAQFEGAEDIGAEGIAALSSGDDLASLLRQNDLQAGKTTSYGADTLTLWERA